jgi:hypothetical protein
VILWYLISLMMFVPGIMQMPRRLFRRHRRDPHRTRGGSLILWPLSDKFPPNFPRTKFALRLLRSDLETWKYSWFGVSSFRICNSSAAKRKWDRQDRPGQCDRNRSTRVYFRRDCSGRIIPDRRINKSQFGDKTREHMRLQFRESY